MWTELYKFLSLDKDLLFWVQSNVHLLKNVERISASKDVKPPRLSGELVEGCFFNMSFEIRESEDSVGVSPVLTVLVSYAVEKNSCLCRLTMGAIDGPTYQKMVTELIRRTSVILTNFYRSYKFQEENPTC